MKALCKLAPLFLTALLGGCVTGPGTPDVRGSVEAEVAIKTLQEMLPGTYSNFAQMHGQRTDAAVTDIRIRQLKTMGEPVFLFEQVARGQDTSSHDIYWLKLNRQAHRAELHFTRLTEDELSLPMQEILLIAWQRVLPGCVIPINRVGERFIGQTNPASCVNDDPLQGKLRFTRSLDLGGDTMTIHTGIEVAGQHETATDTRLELQKHRVFVGWSSFRTGTGPQQDKPGEWQLSQVFHLRDDGRINPLYDQQMAEMAYGLQLSRLHRFDGELPYYQLSVINMQNGQTQAYQWFEPGSVSLNMNLDWFQTSLDLLDPAELQP